MRTKQPLRQNRTSTRTTFVLLGMCSLLLASCQSAGTLSPSQQAPSEAPPATEAGSKVCNLSAGWSLTYTVTGGIAGIMKNLDLDSSSAVSFTSSRPAAETSGTLAPRKLAAIKDALHIACPDLLAAHQPRPCPDCFLSTVTLDAGGRPIEWSTASGQEVPETISTLLTALNRLMDEVGGG